MSPVDLELPAGTRPFHTLVLDFTGTLSLDGALLPGVARRLVALSRSVTIAVLTADTFGTAGKALRELPVEIRLIGDGIEKAEAVAAMGPKGVVAVGNGRSG